MPEITPEERVQKVKEHLLEDLEFEPEQVRNFFVTNLFQRAFSHLVGWTGKKSLMLRCTSAGEIKTALTTTGIEDYTRWIGGSPDNWSTAYGWPQVASRLDIFIWNYPVLIKIKKADETSGDDLEIPVGFYSVDIRNLGFQIKNKTPGETATFQVVGWW
ncbi:hypothetical protein ES703_50629 [subsurface metagenome]